MVYHPPVASLCSAPHRRNLGRHETGCTLSSLNQSTCFVFLGANSVNRFVRKRKLHAPFLPPLSFPFLPVSIFPCLPPPPFSFPSLRPPHLPSFCAHRMDFAEIKRRLRRFAVMDRDKDGYITAEDLAHYLNVPSDACLHAVFSAINRVSHVMFGEAEERHVASSCSTTHLWGGREEVTHGLVLSYYPSLGRQRRGHAWPCLVLLPMSPVCSRSPRRRMAK